MAEADFAGTTEAFEGQYGFLNILSDGGDPDKLTENLGTEIRPDQFGLEALSLLPPGTRTCRFGARYGFTIMVSRRRKSIPLIFICRNTR